MEEEEPMEEAEETGTHMAPEVHDDTGVEQERSSGSGAEDDDGAEDGADAVEVTPAHPPRSGGPPRSTITTLFGTSSLN